jgi:hypothetical protein
VLPKHSEVHRGEELLVPNLDGVLGVSRKRRKKLVRRSAKTSASRPVNLAMVWNSKTKGPVFFAK